MKEIAQILEQILRMIARLLFLIGQLFWRSLGYALRCLYQNRFRILHSKSFSSVALIFFTGWFLYGIQTKMSGQLAEKVTPSAHLSFIKRISAVRSIVNNPQLTAEYVQLTGVSPDRNANLQLTHRIHTWLGTPQQDGGNTKSGTDCSGFVQAVFRETYGVALERSSSAMYTQDVMPVKKEQLQEGDLVFFTTSSKLTEKKAAQNRKISHVGIYLRNQRFAHTSTRKGVTVSSLQEPYYQNAFYGAGRVKRVGTAM